MSDNASYGKVYLIGAGPGDEGLFTLKGAECLKQCDVLVYDYLANKELLKFCPEECEMIYAGKKASDHTLTQDEINDLIVEKAKAGKTVARLKGGDPFVFGRGGEEALRLVENGIEFEVVPGITAATAATAYAGIPITQRGISVSAAMITGHEDPKKETSDIEWEYLSKGLGSLVFYMGVKNLPKIVAELKKHGRPGGTPVALIRWGTMPHQETLTGTLDTITQKAEEYGMKPPALIVVGDVVKLRENLRWFDRKPLFGKKIVVTRSRHQASSLSSGLKALGAHVVEFPTIDIQPVDDFTELDAAVARIPEYTWLLFTSVNSVDIFFKRLTDIGLDARALHSLKIAVIGSEVAKRTAQYGIRYDLIPEKFTSEGLFETFLKSEEAVSGKKFLIPTSEIAREFIIDQLKDAGAEPEKVTVYRNEIPEYTKEEIEDVFADEPDLITFTSSSTVANLIEILEKAGCGKYRGQIRGASIGPVTTEKAHELSVDIVTEPGTSRIPDLIDAIRDYFSGE